MIYCGKPDYCHFDKLSITKNLRVNALFFAIISNSVVDGPRRPCGKNARNTEPKTMV